jgi:hypothetical protein
MKAAYGYEVTRAAARAASTLVFRGVVHTKINAVVLFCFIDKKIFHNVLPSVGANGSLQTLQ